MARIAAVFGVAGLLACLVSPAVSAVDEAAQQVPASSADAKVSGPPLDNTLWKAIELGGQPVAAAKPSLEARLILADGKLQGADGCAAVSGSYQTMGPIIKFGPLEETARTCANGDVTARALRQALADAHVFRIKEQRLELIDRSGTILARFAAPAPKAPPSVAAPALAGTVWRFVRFRGADSANLEPEAHSSYTLDFRANGSLTAVIGCHRADAPWRATGRSELQIGALVLKGRRCSAGALHDHLIRNLGRVRSYVIRDTHLFLALMADTGVYEYEPVQPPAKSAATRRSKPRA
jgi:heat shock protein HslJ